MTASSLATKKAALEQTGGQGASTQSRSPTQRSASQPSAADTPSASQRSRPDKPPSLSQPSRRSGPAAPSTSSPIPPRHQSRPETYAPSQSSQTGRQRASTATPGPSKSTRTPSELAPGARLPRPRQHDPQSQNPSEQTRWATARPREHPATQTLPSLPDPAPSPALSQPVAASPGRDSPTLVQGQQQQVPQPTNSSDGQSPEAETSSGLDENTLKIVVTVLRRLKAREKELQCTKAESLECYMRIFASGLTHFAEVDVTQVSEPWRGRLVAIGGLGQPSGGMTDPETLAVSSSAASGKGTMSSRPLASSQPPNRLYLVPSIYSCCARTDTQSARCRARRRRRGPPSAPGSIPAPIRLELGCAQPDRQHRPYRYGSAWWPGAPARRRRRRCADQQRRTATGQAVGYKRG